MPIISRAAKNPRHGVAVSPSTHRRASTRGATAPLNSADVTVLVDDDEEYVRYARQFHGAGVVVTTDRSVAEAAPRLLIGARAASLAGVAMLASHANSVHRLIGLLIRTPSHAHWVPRFLSEARFSALRRTHAYADREVLGRVLGAFVMDSAEESIADAACHDEELWVLACDFSQHRFPFSAVRALARMPEDERETFVIAKDGAYVHWPISDVHLTLPDLRAAVDPALGRAASLARIQEGELFGRAVRRLREKHGLFQSQIPGLSARHLRRIEQGESGASVSDDVLVKLASAHNLEPEHYLEAVVDSMSGYEAMR